MGRPRKNPLPPEPDDDEPDVETVDLIYEGPPGQVVIGLGALEEGELYEVEAKLAERLLASSVHWKEA